MNVRRGMVALFLLIAMVRPSWAGGSGLNVLIVVNQASSNSVQLGNYYAEQRQVPPQNFLRINWAGGRTVWSEAEFNTHLLNPMLEGIVTRQLTNQVDYVMLSMDIPYRVLRTGPATLSGENSTTAALYYGFKPDYAEPSYSPSSCNLPAPSSNSYAGSEGIFRASPPDTALTNSFLAMMITSSNLSLAKAIVDHGVSSDGSLSSHSVVLGKSSDPARNVRFMSFDNAIFDGRLHGGYTVVRTNLDTPYSLSNLLGYQNGHYTFSIQPNTFVPGAMADSLTSYGGRIYEVNDHTTLLAFLGAGASGSYGTVVEPCNYLEKFPSPQTYFFQSRGFSLAECYYQSITNPYQGLLVGEPLAAPFAQPAQGFWGNLLPNAVLSGTTNLSLYVAASHASRPVQQVDLFVDGRYTQTITNIAPGQNNVLSVNIRGRPMTYVVPAGATIQSVVAGLAGVINLPSSTNATRVRAFPHGDRIELRSFDASRAAASISLSASSSAGSGGILTTFVAASAPGFLDTAATGLRSYGLSGNPGAGSYLQLVITKTNGAQVSLAVTNILGSTTLPEMARQLVAVVNGHTDLSGPDGLNGQDFFDTSPWTLPNQTAQFNLVANSPGWASARIEVVLRASAEVTIDPSAAVTLEQNLSDLQPRAHLYITAGVTNLPMVFPFPTMAHPDGSHLLTAVVYEGSHVRAQRRISEEVFIRNHGLAATFSTLLGGSNTALEATLEFAIVANTGDIESIELFSTGGLLDTVASVSAARFPVPAANLGIGLHPFYAIVTSTAGNQYRTETRWIRIVGEEAPFQISLTAPPPTLSWPASAGRTYEILRAANPAGLFQVSATLTPSNTAARWSDTNPSAPSRFYRVRTSN